MIKTAFEVEPGDLVLAINGKAFLTPVPCTKVQWLKDEMILTLTLHGQPTGIFTTPGCEVTISEPALEPIHDASSDYDSAGDGYAEYMWERIKHG